MSWGCLPCGTSQHNSTVVVVVWAWRVEVIGGTFDGSCVPHVEHGRRARCHANYTRVGGNNRTQCEVEVGLCGLSDASRVPLRLIRLVMLFFEKVSS